MTSKTRLLISACGLMLLVPAFGAAQSSKKAATPEPRYTISGQITGMAAGRHATVVASAPGKPSHSATTHDDGTFLIRNVQHGTYGVKPSHPMYTFNPYLRTVPVTDHDVTDRDLTAHAKPAKKR